MLTVVIVLFLLISIIWGSSKLVRSLKNRVSWLEIFIGVIYIFSLLIFMLGLAFHSNHYDTPIDPVDSECYIPFSHSHFLTLIVFYVLYLFSNILVWIKDTRLPPLTMVFSMVFMIIGIAINIATVYQVSVHNTESIDMYVGNDGSLFFIFSPIIISIISIVLIIRIINKRADEVVTYTYKHKVLRRLSIILADRKKQPLFALLLLLPVFFVITLVLLLFGQHPDSMIKVFTDTTTWRLSQQMHPPILDHQGHYLCTVAAKGSPAIVKPVRMGIRNNAPIIVNRQLMIANAFEEMVQHNHQGLHCIIRTTYDRYGYNLSTIINTVKGSTITYILMKPLEWFFLLCLYLFHHTPEQLIRKQYQ